jgi:hypothetical protein
MCISSRIIAAIGMRIGVALTVEPFYKVCIQKKHGGMNNVYDLFGRAYEWDVL